MKGSIFQLTFFKDFSIAIELNLIGIIGAIVLVGIVYGLIVGVQNAFSKRFEIDQASIGLGNSSISIRPNESDKQVAYKIWVELSTRKIGLPIDLTDDVVVEIYDSWYDFFRVTRELVKDIPVKKYRNKSTREIINISIDVLNKGLRPHLTKWQARFRRWYDYEIRSNDNIQLSPQELQMKFPEFEELKRNLLEVNAKLIAYRASMESLITQ